MEALSVCHLRRPLWAPTQRGRDEAEAGALKAGSCSWIRLRREERGETPPPARPPPPLRSPQKIRSFVGRFPLQGGAGSLFTGVRGIVRMRSSADELLLIGFLRSSF